MIFRFQLLILLLLFPGCAGQRALPLVTPEGPALPSASCLLEVETPDGKQQFDLHIERRIDEVVFVGLTRWGTRAFTVHVNESGGFAVEQLYPGALPVPALHLAGAVQLAIWPLETLQIYYAPRGLSVTSCGDKACYRRVRNDRSQTEVAVVSRSPLAGAVRLTITIGGSDSLIHVVIK